MEQNIFWKAKLCKKIYHKWKDQIYSKKYNTECSKSRHNLVKLLSFKDKEIILQVSEEKSQFPTKEKKVKLA